MRAASTNATTSLPIVLTESWLDVSQESGALDLLSLMEVNVLSVDGFDARRRLRALRYLFRFTYLYHYFYDRLILHI